MLIYKYKLFLSLTRTHTHTCKSSVGMCVSVLSNWNTQGAVCYMEAVGFGWRAAWLSAPVFAAVIGSVCYFEASGVHKPAKPATHTERALNG